MALLSDWEIRPIPAANQSMSLPCENGWKVFWKDRYDERLAKRDQKNTN
jgi:hypothetical protein